MPMFPEFNEDAFSVMVDPQTGRITLISPAPIVTFDNIDEYNIGCHTENVYNTILISRFVSINIINIGKNIKLTL